MLRRVHFGGLTLFRATHGTFSHAQKKEAKRQAKKEINHLSNMPTTNTLGEFLSAFQKCRNLSVKDMAHAVMTKFLRFDNPSTESISLALACFERCNLPTRLALEIIEAHEPRGVLNGKHFTTVLESIVFNRVLSSRSLTLARRIILQCSEPLHPIVVTSILSLYAELSDEMFSIHAASILEDTVRLFSLQREKGIQIPQHQYYTKLVILGRCGRLDLIDNICASAVCVGYEKDVFMLTALMKAYTYAKEYDKAMDVFHLATEQGLIHRTVTIAQVLDDEYGAQGSFRMA